MYVWCYAGAENVKLYIYNNAILYSWYDCLMGVLLLFSLGRIFDIKKREIMQVAVSNVYHY